MDWKSRAELWKRMAKRAFHNWDYCSKLADKNYKKWRSGKCYGTIPRTFVACGEAPDMYGYCCKACELRAAIKLIQGNWCEICSNFTDRDEHQQDCVVGKAMQE